MKELLLLHIISLGLGIILDQIIGDPHSFPHPIRAIGSLVASLEKRFLDPLLLSRERDGAKERRRGRILWALVVISVAAAALFAVAVSYCIHKYLGVFVETVLTCYILAARSLSGESMAVYRQLEKGDIDKARQDLSMIVGRDTDSLDEEEITKAAVETVAENTSDGVIAPLLYTVAGGPVLGFIYKAVNTMDSMLGYRDERYENFGRFAARADDVFNYLPSRLSAVLMILGSFILGLFSKDYSGKRAFGIWRRDRLNHKSPNSAQTESACAGALGLKLGGTHLYKGIPVVKPEIGDEIRKAEPEDIRRAGRLMFITEALVASVCILLLVLIMLFC